MTRSNLLAVISFAVVFAAGVVVGKRGWGGGGSAAPDSSLASQLALTQKQREDVRKIWQEQLAAATVDPAVRWKRAEEDRDADVRAILTPDQQPAYAEIVKRHQARVDAFRSDLAASQRTAEQRTKEVLSPRQREKFEKLVQERARSQAAAGYRPAAIPVSDLRPETTAPKDAQDR